MRLLPHDQTFFSLFEQHGRKLVDGCRALLDMIEHPLEIESKAERVTQIEHECDEITHTVVESLHKTFITPLDRNDIHTLITRMDDVMDLVESVADRFFLYEIAEMPNEVAAMTRCLLLSAEQVLAAVSGLREMKKPHLILEHCIEINRQENVADKILRGALARLFREQADPIVIIKWKEIYEALESATDRCEDVANIIEGVILENS